MRKPRNPVARHLRESGKFRAQVVRPRKGTGSYKRAEAKGRRPDSRRDGVSNSGRRVSAEVLPQHRRAAAATCRGMAARGSRWPAGGRAAR